MAVSGGVDSLCALLLLHEQGHELVAVHGIFQEAQKLPAPAALRAEQKIAGLRAICGRLAIPLYSADLASLFAARVISPFAKAWASGFTPNPCAICNRDMKFGALFNFAMVLGADKFATGHYASLAQNPHAGAVVLKRGASRKKDQSYFLGLVPRGILSRLAFPLAAHEKDFCMEFVRSRGFNPPDDTESQDICFMNGQSCQDFLACYWRENALLPGAPGPMILDGKTIGRHKGLWNYTIGQRKGLGIAHSEPLYVIRKDFYENRLVLGERADLGMQKIAAGAVNLFVPAKLWPEKILAKFRHGGEPVPARASYDGKRMVISLDERHFPTARGQVAAIYDFSEHLLAAGIVRETGA